MPEFCDVAVPVPLDMVFTYRVPADTAPVVGGRVLVPFRQQRMTGIVVELHDRKPSVTTKNILERARHRRRCSTSNCCNWAAGLPTITSPRSAKSSAPCCR